MFGGAFGGRAISMRILLALAVAVGATIAAWAVSAQAQPGPAPQVVLTPPPVYTPPPQLATPSAAQPLASPAVLPSSSPAPLPSATPLTAPATPSPYHFVYLPTPSPGATDPPSDAPAILEIDLNDQALHAPGPINIRVVTSPPVSTVTMHALGHAIPLPKIADGIFAVDNQLPAVPFWFHGKTYQVDFIAAVPDGRSTKVTIPVTLR